MKHELLDVFDANEQLLGSASRKEVHEKGYWHRTFHCWIISPAPERTILFQKRHHSKDVFPGMLDKSAAGHLLAGENPEDGLRELEEELGVSWAVEDLTFCGTVQVENVTDELLDREFCHVYMAESNRPIESYHVQAVEVAGLYRVNVNDYKLLVTGQTDRITVTGAEWDERENRWTPSEWQAGPDDFTPQNDAYYRLLFQSIANYDSL